MASDPEKHLRELVEREAERRIVVVKSRFTEIVVFADGDTMFVIAEFRSYGGITHESDAEGFAATLRARYVNNALG